MTRFYRDGSRVKHSADDERYGSEVPPWRRSRYSPRGNDQRAPINEQTQETEREGAPNRDGGTRRPRP